VKMQSIIPNKRKNDHLRQELMGHKDVKLMMIYTHRMENPELM
jgi:integrase